MVKLYEFRIEYYIDNGDKKDIKLSALDEKDTKQWKRDMEARALSEYYQEKIKVSNIKI